MKRLSDILKEAMTPGFEKAFASTPKGVEVHMKHKETGKIVKTKFLGTHSAVAAAKKHINDMQGKGYTVHAKKLIEEVEQLGELKTSTLISYHTKSQKSAAELGNKASKEMDAGNMKSASALLKKVSKRQKSQSQAMGKIQKRYANLKDEVEHTDEAVTDYNPKSQGGTRKELLAKYAETGNSKHAEAARRAGASHEELKKAQMTAMKRGVGKKGSNYLLSKNEEVELTDEAMSHQAATTMKHIKPGTLKQNYGDKQDAANIKPGISGVADRLAMLARAKKEGRLKEEVEQFDEELQESLLEILREMAKRGRPKKNPTAPAPSKMSKDDDEEENEEPDTGPEADKNITVQLKKAADQAVHGEKGGADIEFADGKKHFVHGHVAHKVLNAMEKMKPAQRAEAQKGIHQSHAHLMAVHKMLSR